MKQDIHQPSVEEVQLSSKKINANLNQVELCIPEMHCGSCMNKLETELEQLDSVYQVRANLTRKRIRVQWFKEYSPKEILQKISSIGFSANLLDDQSIAQQNDTHSSLRALAVAGFAASNVMLLSVAVWSGADDATRQLFHWLSAAIALPAVLYAGNVFFSSAWRALRVGKTNMDVPVSVGIVLSIMLGLFDTVNHNDQVYFEAATMLVFFLLIGRTLEIRMRARANSMADGLRSLEPLGAFVRSPDGTLDYRATNELSVNDIVVVEAGHRFPVDGLIESGSSTIDTAIVDGESNFKTIHESQPVFAGTLNVSENVLVKVTATADDSFLSHINELVRYAANKKGVFTNLADKAARWYAPFVHVSAIFAFIGWFASTGDMHRSITIAISVLIITCPCALALAVPLVQVLAGTLLLKKGIIMKDGIALEKLADIGIIVFDKTGTLTTETSVLSDKSVYSNKHLELVKQMTRESEHPFAQALLSQPSNTNETTRQETSPEWDVQSFPGYGLEATYNNQQFRFGKRAWAANSDGIRLPEVDADYSESVLSIDGEIVACFLFANPIRTGAIQAIDKLKNQGIKLAIVSGDKSGPVSTVANLLSIAEVHSSISPAEKVSIVEALADKQTVLMVGDGVNDAGAMAAADVSMAPGSAASVGRSLANFIFLNQNMHSVPYAIAVAKKSKQISKQNISLAVLYNLMVLPMAFAGLVSPLVAALAMSLSSVLVVGNSMRLRYYALSFSDQSIASKELLNPTVVKTL